MKTLKNIVLVLSLAFNVIVLVYAFQQRAHAEEALTEAMEQQAIAEESRRLAEEQMKMAEQQAAIAQEARAEALKRFHEAQAK